MIELRENKLTGEWVAISPYRAERPSVFKNAGLSSNDKLCPFCKENSHMTPNEIMSSEHERIRIVPNKYPVVKEDSELGYGFHDVVIDTDIHDELIHNFSTDNIFILLDYLQKRVLQLSSNKKIKYIQIFKNQGVDAGASQIHSHCQIISLPIIPLMQKIIYDNSLRIYGNTGNCHVCSTVLQNKDLIFYENDVFVAYCPSASKFPFQMEITSKKHFSNFSMFDNNHLKSLTDIFKICVVAINKIYENLDYNICFMDSIINTNLKSINDCMHFYLQIIPRRGKLAGYEFSTLGYINSIRPEEATERLIQIIQEL